MTYQAALDERDYEIAARLSGSPKAGEASVIEPLSAL
jgi:hypothetical protein